MLVAISGNVQDLINLRIKPLSVTSHFDSFDRKY